MLMKSENLLKIKNKLKKYLADKEIVDIIVFGSAIKGKVEPRDIDIAVIGNKKIEIQGDFHVSYLKTEDFFVNQPSIVTTLLREGYSLKNKKPLSESLRFQSRALYRYELSSLSNSQKVKIVNVLRGLRGSKGM